MGKVLFSLIDATSNLPDKMARDRGGYIRDKMLELLDHSRLCHAFSSLGYVQRAASGRVSILNPATQSLLNTIQRRGMRGQEKFAQKLKDDLLAYQQFLNSGEWKEIASDPAVLYYAGGTSYISTRTKRVELSASRVRITVDKMNNDILECIDEIDRTFYVLEHNSDLSRYAQESINQTLNKEFSGQIQPVSAEPGLSRILLAEREEPYFNLTVQDNQISNNCFFSSPFRRTYLIDNPFVLDQDLFEQQMFLLALNNPTKDESGSLFNPGTVLSHTIRLYSILHSKRRPNPLEQTILEDTLRPIMEKINSVVPGTFDFSGDREFYVRPDGGKLVLSNLAAGSKMFSIVKILLSRGLLDENTLLILDEPETHLHPQWQSQFAEIIVLLVKELRVNVLLTTHSSDFMLAIDAYMRRYNIHQLCNFYQTERMENGSVTHKCVNDNMGAIYQDFVEPMEESKFLRDWYDMGADAEADGDSGL